MVSTTWQWGEANKSRHGCITKTPETLEVSVTEETSAAVGTATTAEALAKGGPRDETTALRKQQQQGWRQYKRQLEHETTPTNSRDARIGGKPGNKWKANSSCKL